MPKIHAGLNGVASLVERPVIAVPIDVLDLLQRVTEGIFAKTQEVVALSIKRWRSKVDCRTRLRGDSKSAPRNIFRAGKFAQAAGVGPYVISLQLVDHLRAYSPGVMQSHRVGLDRVGEAGTGQERRGDRVLARPGIPAPEIHVGCDHVIHASRRLVPIRWTADHNGIAVA